MANDQMFKAMLPSPKCGNPYVLAQAPVMVAVGPGYSSYPWGDNQIVPLAHNTPAFCNDLDCGWTGTAGDVRR